MKNLSTGFYKELDELREQGISDANFGFLESVEVGDYYNLYDFLHGHCDEFAAALSDYYGYPIEYILDTSNVLVHAYCTTEISGVKAYIDARGITTDSVRFFDEFADFCTYEKETGRFYDLKGECSVLQHNNTREMYGDDNREPNQDKDFVEFFKDNNSYYDIKVFERELLKSEKVDLEVDVVKYEVKQSVLNCKNIETAIRRAKSELVQQEMHENFGQEYVRAIKDKFKVGLSYSLEDKINMSLLNGFDHWCATYVPQKDAFLREQTKNTNRER